MKKLFFSVAFIFSLVMAPVSGLADDVLKVVSEYSGSGAHNILKSKSWVIKSLSDSGSRTTLSFHTDSLPGTFVCDIDIQLSEEPYKIIWRGENGSRVKKSLNGLLIVPGFPAPCEILPVYQKESTCIYKDMSQAGGSFFEKKYNVVMENINIPDARDKGWIGKDEVGPKPLKMITVYDERGELVVKQLWPDGAKWWLYEETPFRRSRLVR